MHLQRFTSVTALVSPIAAACFAAFACSQAADAGVALNEYTLYADIPAGEDTVVSPGDSVTVNVSLLAFSGTPAHNAAIFRAAFSQPGFTLTSYAWSPPYITGNAFDDSRPSQAALPALITPELVSDFGEPDEVADIEFSNVVPSGFFTSGQILSFQFLVPDNAPAGQFLVSLVPDTVSFGFDDVTTHEGPRLLFIVIPAPAAFSLLAAIGLGLSRRRRTSF
jgi:hypothetical protein